MGTVRDGRRRPTPANLLAACCAVQGVSGVVGGLGLVSDPSGESLGFSRRFLEGTPFGSYLVPGLVLLVLLGLLPLVAFYGLVRNRSWSWLLSVALGAVLMTWLTTEIVLIGGRLFRESPSVSMFLWVFYGVVGASILVLGQLPSVRAHYRAARADEAGDSSTPAPGGRSPLFE